MTQTAAARPPRIAVACSGLGHIRRGIESWANDLGRALRTAGADVTVFSGAPIEDAIALPCCRRTGGVAKALDQVTHHLGGWRYGMGNSYEVEQTTFSLPLWWRVRHDFDLLHTQDHIIAKWLEAAKRRGLSRARVIFANGTGESAAAMRRFRYLQLLTPPAMAEWEDQKPPNQSVFMIPNFIDTARFVPGDSAAARAALGLPQHSLIVLTCAAIRRYHKRIDYLLAEFATIATAAGRELLLVVVGGREADTDSLIAMGGELLGERVRFFVGMPREQMPMLYQAADLFVLTSLWEMFGIVLIEAMASGLPVICNDSEAFRYVAGPAALYADMREPGSLAAALTEALVDNRRQALAAVARPHVDARFSQPVVTRQILDMYQKVHRAPQ
jgi:glycosyltransferase involved in cell wall biosynthesis